MECDTVTGGEKVRVQAARANPTGLEAYKRYYPGARYRDVKEAFDETDVRRMADGSPYYISEYHGIRFVWVRTEGRTIEGGNFTLVNVEEVR